ncbi:dihydropyrimidine dehydrogenase (NAD+) subunit PreT [Elusimicrobium posterum]|uniref:NAD(P)-dependent oxidoreductase n=1 Tax=Elusimicrobium posterum TaxID=3116653 RepID=UPI003C78C5CB
MKKRDYLKEVEKGFTLEEAMKEASRCLMCANPVCSKNCPAGTDPGAFIKAMRTKSIEDAVKIVRENNILAAVCSRVCPFEDLCEGSCIRSRIDTPIKIGKLQRFVTDYESTENLQILKKPEGTLEKIAIIGSGPAALSVGTALALKNYRVTIFESRPKAGGIMTYGIAPFRLPQEIVDSEIEIIKNLGVEFRTSTHVGRDVSIGGLRREGYKAFVLAMGRPFSKDATVKGVDLAGVVNALEYLYSARSTDGKFEAGRNVAIIGGGNTAMDCANTAKILGAENVYVLYRRRKEDMPASNSEIEYAERMGIEWMFETQISEILGRNGDVTALKCVSKEEGEFTLPIDTVVFAIGQDSQNINAIAKVALDDNNQIIIKPGSFLTSADDIFAAGDSVNGGKTVVQAIAEGKACAESIDSYLTEKREQA